MEIVNQLLTEQGLAISMVVALGFAMWKALSWFAKFVEKQHQDHLTELKQERASREKRDDALVNSLDKLTDKLSK